MSREVLRLASLKPELQRNNHQRFLSHLPLPPDTSTTWSYTASLALANLYPPWEPRQQPASRGSFIPFSYIPVWLIFSRRA
jgi:hypothetical protein